MKMNWVNLVAVQPFGNGLPVFSVLGDGASRLLPKHLGTSRPFYAFQHQGNDGYRLQFDTVEGFAAHCIDELKDARPTGPYLLFGYSYGGMVAYEMAQQLVKQGDQVPLLALLDTYVPSMHMTAMKKHARFYTPLKAAIMRSTIERKLNKGSVLKGRLRHFHIIDTYHQAMVRYLPVPFHGPLMLMRAERSLGTVDLGWRDLASGGLDLHVIPGDHFDLVKEPNVGKIASILAARIAKIEEQLGVAVPSRPWTGAP